jgi:hypothetical protein
MRPTDVTNVRPEGAPSTGITNEPPPPARPLAPTRWSWRLRAIVVCVVLAPLVLCAWMVVEALTTDPPTEEEARDAIAEALREKDGGWPVDALKAADHRRDPESGVVEYVGKGVNARWSPREQSFSVRVRYGWGHDIYQGHLSRTLSGRWRATIEAEMEGLHRK